MKKAAYAALVLGMGVEPTLSLRRIPIFNRDVPASSTSPVSIAGIFFQNKCHSGGGTGRHVPIKNRDSPQWVYDKMV